MEKDRKMSISEYVKLVMSELPQDSAPELEIYCNDQGEVDDCGEQKIKLPIYSGQVPVASKLGW